MPKSKRSFLVDLNVWLALAYDLHVHHDRARQWFETIGDGQAAFCRLTQLGLLRLLTNLSVMKADVLSQKKAWEICDRLIADRRVRFIGEPEQLDQTFRNLTRSSQPARNLWSDAYLAALGKSSGLAMVSFDRAFAKMPGVETVIL